MKFGALVHVMGPTEVVVYCRVDVDNFLLICPIRNERAMETLLLSRTFIDWRPAVD